MTPHKERELNTMLQLVDEAEAIIGDPNRPFMNSANCCTRAGRSRGISRRKSQIPTSTKFIRPD